MWSYLLAGLGITGLIVARRRPTVGWWFNIAAQAAWTAYAISTRQWGFLASGVGYTYAYVRLLRAAQSARRRERAQGGVDRGSRQAQLDEEPDAGERVAVGAVALP